MLPDVVRDNPTLAGLNVTIPHKQAVIPLLDSLSDEARAIGAVNVIKIDRRGDHPLLRGYNADVIGFTRSIRPLLRPSHRAALVLGTGGASKAVVHGPPATGPRHAIRQRTPHDGAIGLRRPDARRDGRPHRRGELHTRRDVPPRRRLPRPALRPRHAPSTCSTTSSITPAKRVFLRRAAERGATTKNGLEMLHLQGRSELGLLAQRRLSRPPCNRPLSPLLPSGPWGQ